MTERAILNLMLFNAECLHRGLISLRTEDFAEGRNADLFEAMRRCAEASAVVDLVTILPYTQDGGKYVFEVSTEYFPRTSFDAYLDALHAQNRRRRAIAAARRAIAAAEENADGWESLLEDAAAAARAGGGTVEPSGKRAIEAIQELRAERKASAKTGFPRLDAFTKGLCPGELLVLAARPSVGKTSFALNVAINVAASGGAVAMFSLETSECSLLRRAVYSLSGKPESLILCENEVAVDAALDAARRLSEMPLYICDRALITADELVEMCYKIKRSAGRLDLVVIDYLQLMATKGGKNATREQLVSENSRRMKLLAMDIKVPVLLLSQLSRNIERREDKTPLLSDLRESGAIEQDADCVLLLDTAADREQRRIIVAKNRNGPRGTVTLDWHGPTFTFKQAWACPDGLEDEKQAKNPEKTQICLLKGGGGA